MQTPVRTGIHPAPARRKQDARGASLVSSVSVVDVRDRNHSVRKFSSIDPPMNSRRIELSGTASAPAGRNHCRNDSSRLASRYSRRVGPHLQQQRLGLRPQHRQLVHQRRVEDGVAVLGEREDVQPLAALDAVPAPQRLGGAVAARGRVAHDAPDQPRVGDAHAVVPIEVQLRDRRHVDAVDRVVLAAPAPVAGSARECPRRSRCRADPASRPGPGCRVPVRNEYRGSSTVAPRISPSRCSLMSGTSSAASDSKSRSPCSSSGVRSRSRK